MVPTVSDNDLMGLALLEASRVSKSATRPNPRVGAALLSTRGEIITGHHKVAGGPHAEIEVIAECARRGVSTQDATLAVTLEPCSHYGKTPPCADAIIAAGIRRVIYAVQDPFPAVSGQGKEKLQQKNIEVLEGVGAEAAFQINREWLTAHARGWPFVRLKMATSLDGLMTSEDRQSQWITGAEARERGQRLRAEAEAIFTGVGTVICDDPRFTARDASGLPLPRQPQLWVLGRKEYDLSSFQVSTHPNFKGLLREGEPKKVLRQAYESGICEVLVEAGPSLSHAFLEAGLFDEIHLFQGTSFLGGKGLHLAALRGGTLPGLGVELAHVEQISRTDLYLVLKALPKETLPFSPT